MSLVAIHTLGCKLNFSESSTIVRQLEKNGFTRVDFTEKADIYIINTCSVTDNADKKCRNTVKGVLKQNPNAYVVVIGCYAQFKPKEISGIPGVDMVLGAAEKFNMIEHRFMSCSRTNCSYDSLSHTSKNSIFSCTTY